MPWWLWKRRRCPGLAELVWPLLWIISACEWRQQAMQKLPVEHRHYRRRGRAGSEVTLAIMVFLLSVAPLPVPIGLVMAVAMVVMLLNAHWVVMAPILVWRALLPLLTRLCCGCFKIRASTIKVIGVVLPLRGASLAQCCRCQRCLSLSGLAIRMSGAGHSGVSWKWAAVVLQSK